MLSRLWRWLRPKPEQPPDPAPAAMAPGSAHAMLFGRPRAAAEQPAPSTPIAAVPAVQPFPAPAVAAARDEEPPPLVFIADIAALSVATTRPEWDAGAPRRLALADTLPPRPMRPLLPGTEPFAPEWLIGHHARGTSGPALPAACYFAADAVISGSGQIWLDGRLVTADEIMPGYVRNELAIAAGGSPGLRKVGRLPLRTIEEPTVVLLGHGVHVYGHFLIEMLFRLLEARCALPDGERELRFLLDAAAPDWLLRILTESLGVARAAIVTFDTGRERVKLRQAIIPTNLGGSERGFHPFAGTLIDALLERMALPDPARRGAQGAGRGRRLFVSRRSFKNAASGGGRVCLNEDQLTQIAGRRHGFEEVTMESLSWPMQVALFRHAEIVVGPWGSAMHTSLFSAPGSRMGVIGFGALVQSNIAALRGTDIGFLARNLRIQGAFSVDEEQFKVFLDAVCDGG